MWLHSSEFSFNDQSQRKTARFVAPRVDLACKSLNKYTELFSLCTAEELSSAGSQVASLMLETEDRTTIYTHKCRTAWKSFIEWSKRLKNIYIQNS